MKISGKRALVTGGAHRVGKSICMTLAKAGADIAFTYHSAGEEAEQTARDIAACGVRSLAIQCDISDWDDVTAMAKQVQEEFGCVDIIVNSAGLFRRTPLPTDDIETWQRVTRVSIDGTFYVCNALLPCMQENGGVIINILDTAISQAWPGWTAHAVAKAGMEAITRQLALELSPKIRTNAVVGGPVLPAEDMSQQAIANVANKTLLERWGSPEDVAEAVVYLIEADYVIGETLVVDGGERFGIVRVK